METGDTLLVVVKCVIQLKYQHMAVEQLGVLAFLCLNQPDVLGVYL